MPEVGCGKTSRSKNGPASTALTRIGSSVGWGERGEATYFNNPMDYVQHLSGDHLEWLRGRSHLVLVCGQGQWEDTTGALLSTTSFSDVLGSKGLSHELDLWG